MKILKSYKWINVFTYGDGEYKNVYELTIEKYSFFGLFKKEIKVRYDVPFGHSLYDLEKKWNELIKTKEELF